MRFPALHIVATQRCATPPDASPRRSASPTQRFSCFSNQQHAPVAMASPLLLPSSPRATGAGHERERSTMYDRQKFAIAAKTPDPATQHLPRGNDRDARCENHVVKTSGKETWAPPLQPVRSSGGERQGPTPRPGG